MSGFGIELAITLQEAFAQYIRERNLLFEPTELKSPQ